MPDDVRRFPGASDSELRKLVRYYEKRIEGFKHEQKMMGWSSIGSEQWMAEERNIEGDRAHIAEIEAELQRRRNERAEREEREYRRDRFRESASNNSRRRPESPDERTFNGAIEAWSESTEVKLPGYINVSWTANGRQYSGRYYFDSGKLELSLSVPERTPDAQQRGNRYYLPCNTRAQHEAALRSAAPRM